MKALALVCLLVLGGSCRSPATAEEVQAATLYFPPTFKVVDRPRFSFSMAERQRALDEYRDHGADTLFEVVVDGDGRVVKSRLVRTQVPASYHDDLEAHARRFQFTEDAQSLYRAFYFPVRYRYDSELEWVGE